MNHNNGRTLPFPGFSRGIILGQQKPAGPPAGLYYYQIPALIQREGRQLEADTFECRFPLPLEGVGVNFIATAKEIKEKLMAVAPELPEPKVILLAPIFLGYVPQEVVDRAASAIDEATERKEEPTC